MKNVDKQRCFGCGACSDSCPVQAVIMEQDENGFAYPIHQRGSVHRLQAVGRCVSLCRRFS